MSLAIILPNLSPRDEEWLFCIFIMTMLTAHTALKLTGQILLENGLERRLWLLSASAVAGFGRLAVQLALVRLLESSGDVRFGVRLILLAYVTTFAGRCLAFRSVLSSSVRLQTLLSAGILEGLTLFIAQVELFRAAHVGVDILTMGGTTLLFLCIVSCVAGLRATSSFTHEQIYKKKECVVRFIYVVVVGLFWLLIASIACEHIQLHQVNVPQTWWGRGPILHRASTVILIALAPVLLISAQIAVFLQLRGRLWRRDFIAREDQHRIDSAFVEQKLIRMQNEALIEEIRERKKIEAKLMQAAFKDLVTGLHNRVYVANYLHEREERRRGSNLSALLYIDIDNFKSVNDMLGHSQGDQCLAALASRLRNCIRAGDVLACMGSDEFVVLLNRMRSRDHGMRLAQQILNVMEQPIEVAGTTFNLTVSIGFCMLDAGYGSAEAVLRDADLAMYVAKRKGGSQIAIYQASMLTETLASLNAKAELAMAIENNEFTLFYQPLVHMRDGSVYGVEALIRWEHPNKGVVAPAHFIPLAEQTGRIVEIGNWVLRQACKEYAQLKNAASKNLLLSLNVSTRQLELPSFLELLKQTLTDTDVPPQCLQLEITESILLSDPVRMGGIFKVIRDLGVKIAFDDFGTGYSSLSYIQKYPIDTLKIDQSFVRALKDGPLNLEIIAIMMKLARLTSMSVSAEGIETDAEAAKLLSIGCTVAQGYLYSRPMPLKEALTYLSIKADLMEVAPGNRSRMTQGYKSDVVQ